MIDDKELNSAHSFTEGHELTNSEKKPTRNRKNWVYKRKNWVYREEYDLMLTRRNIRILKWFIIAITGLMGLIGWIAFIRSMILR